MNLPGWMSKPQVRPIRVRVLGIVLAGGEGTQLCPLTRERAMPAVPFGGKYRIIDFVLSNFINSGIHSVYVLTQFRSQSLLQHLSEGWQFGGVLRSQFVVPVPAQMRSSGETGYQGAADAIYQHINLVEQSNPDVVAIFRGDHICRMNIASMIGYHVQKGAEVTVATIPVETTSAADFGVVETSEDGQILAFHKERNRVPAIRGDSGHVDASMGNYVFSTRFLLRLLRKDAADANSAHAFGRDVLPKLVGKAGIYAYDFQTNRIPGEPPDSIPYWRDVGTIDTYYEANMDLRAVKPALNLYNREWPVRSVSHPDAPAKFTFDQENRRGQAIDSIVCGGCLLTGGTVRNSVLGPGVRVHSGAAVDECVILDNCDIGRRAQLHKVILDKYVRVPEDAVIGHDLEHDRQLYYVTKTGIVVVSGNRKPVAIGTLEVSVRPARWNTRL